MNHKLTLSIDAEVAERAKQYAKQSGRSLSDLVEAYLLRITEAGRDKEELPAEFEGLFGVIQLPAEEDDKALIRSIVRDKHGR